MSFIPSALYDSLGNPIGSLNDPDMGRMLATVTQPKGWALADGLLSNYTVLRGFGYDAGVTSTLKDINGYAGNTLRPTSAIALTVRSTSASDVGSVLASGTATGGSTSVLIDTGKDFVTLGIAEGDFLCNDTDSVVGVVATVDSATQVTVSGAASQTYSGKVYRLVRATSTGAAIVEHHGIGANWEELTELVVLNGDTVNGVATALSYRRSNNFHVMGAGSAEAPVGNISLVDAATKLVTYNFISADLNMGLQAHYTVPEGHSMFITSWHADPSSNKPMKTFLRATVDFYERTLIPNLFQVQDVMVTAKQHRFDMPMKFPARCDVKISSAVLGAGTGECGAGFEFWLEHEI